MKFLLSLIFAILLPISIIAQSTGILKFRTDLKNYYILIDDDFENPIQLSGTDSVKINSGTYKFTLIHPNITKRTFRRVIEPNKIEEIIFRNINLTKKPSSRPSHQN